MIKKLKILLFRRPFNITLLRMANTTCTLQPNLGGSQEVSSAYTGEVIPASTKGSQPVAFVFVTGKSLKVGTVVFARWRRRSRNAKLATVEDCSFSPTKGGYWYKLRWQAPDGSWYNDTKWKRASDIDRVLEA